MRAIILAAGQGTRLRPLTDDKPKALVELHGRPLLARSLDVLAGAGIREAVIVTGYMAQQIEDYLGANYSGVCCRYVASPRYATTNNIVSLWEARQYLRDKPFMLLEGDLIYSPVLAKRVLSANAPNIAVVSPYGSGMDGTIVRADDDCVTEFVLKQDQGPDFDYRNALKTVNIYRFEAAAGRELADGLEAWVDAGKTDQYYEAVIGSCIAANRFQLGVLRAAANLWAEADSPDDLRAAEAKFKE